MSCIERRLELPELDITDLDETISPSQHTVEERRLGLSKSDQAAIFKESARIQTTINCSSSDSEEIDEQFTISPSQRTVEERRLGLSKSDQTAKFKKSARVQTTTINCSSSDLEELVRKIDVNPSLGGSMMRGGESDSKPACRSTPRKRGAMPRWTEQVQVAPASGLEPDDGFSWRKYGQKEILGSKYTRHYYRCTYRNTQNCWATKQVQRSDDDSTVVEITYRGRHTCNQTSVDVVPPFTMREGFQFGPSFGTSESELTMNVSATASGINSQAMEKSISDQPDTSLVSLGGSSMRGGESDQKFTLYSTHRKSKAMQQWTEQVRVHLASGCEPDDGFSWTKYGQKAILGSKYPRSYYRCAHGGRRSCSAKKNVQRTDDDPTVVVITYCGRHTCNQTSADVVPSSPMRKNQIDFNADRAKQNPYSQSRDIASNFHGGLPGITPILNSSNGHCDLLSMSSPTADDIFSLMGHHSNFSTPFFSGSRDRLDVIEVSPIFGTPESELTLNVSATTSGNNSQATEKPISDQPETSLVDTVLCSSAAEDQKEFNPFFRIDLPHTKTGHITSEGSLLSDLKEEENATVSTQVEKLVAMQKQRAEGYLVPMQNTQDIETELITWVGNKDADPQTALGKAFSYSCHSELEVGSHCSEAEFEHTDKKMQIKASPEYEASESVIWQMRDTVEPQVEPFSLEVNKDTASEEVHSYFSDEESEVDSYCSGLEYEVGDKKARIEASKGHNDIMRIPKMQEEISPPQEGRPLEGWDAINYDSIVDHLIKSIKRSNIEKLGIYGRNEVGKAFVIKALKESAILRSLFDRVICVTVPLNCDIERMQKEIAAQLSSDLTEANAVDMPHSVMNALEGLKFLLIVVGTNQHMNLETLGIPDSTPPVGSKIVFVAGSGQLCDEVEVDKKICLDDLLLCELFRLKVGEVVYYPKKVLAREIVSMCRHCSHAVILVARALQNVDDILIWKCALDRLSVQPACPEADIEALMVNVLRFSIDQLEDDKTRRCLKNLALCNSHQEIASEFAIGLWVRDGLVETHDEGQKVLKNLVNANLLKVDESGQFVKFQDQDQDILVNLIFQPEENSMFLMRGGLDLIEPPEVEEWESAKVICLMHTGISELPKEPKCPSLSSLFLHRNFKLRKLSSSFFNQMPALEILNLSRTRIRCLPESISQLVSLKRLFLNDCVLLRSISPAIGRLKQLEVFDLEGTKITNLPKEVECLINLNCLGISISGSEPSDGSKPAIPHGVISSLLRLEELNLNVDANAKWWDKCAEGVVSEVCNLKRLSTFKFSFPTLELLRQFNQLRKSMEHPCLAQFRLLVGNHANCIMNRLPLDIEFELERCDRYLRYTNGDSVSTDIRDILQQSDAFFLERHANLKKLSELGINIMDQLKWCVLGECNELEVLVDASDTLHQEASTESQCKSICLESLEFLYVYYMRNLRNIWKGSVQRGSLSSLKLLALCKCPELTVLFSQEMLDNLNNLEEVAIEDCPAIKSLITRQTSLGEICETSYFLPNLKKLSLHYVPKLSSISSGLRIAPRLERLSFYFCPCLKSLSIDEVTSEHLKKIRGERSWWKDLQWRGQKPDHLDCIFVPIDTCNIP